jgi:hypothetical protein
MGVAGKDAIQPDWEFRDMKSFADEIEKLREE